MHEGWQRSGVHVRDAKLKRNREARRIFFRMVEFLTPVISQLS